MVSFCGARTHDWLHYDPAGDRREGETNVAAAMREEDGGVKRSISGGGGGSGKEKGREDEDPELYLRLTRYGSEWCTLKINQLTHWLAR